MSSMLGTLSCRILLDVPLGIACAPHADLASVLCPINEQAGDIEFSVDHVGVFRSSGRFRHFTGRLAIDLEHPERSAVAVDIDAASIDMTWAEALAKLRSSAYFDVARHRTIRFHSTGITAVTDGCYQVSGSLEIRGVTRPQTLEAVRTDPDDGQNPAEYVITGQLSRSAFGMTADRAFVSDIVDIVIVARIGSDGRGSQVVQSE
jgi:polyisoprenoid-binding protein YceI